MERLQWSPMVSQFDLLLSYVFPYEKFFYFNLRKDFRHFWPLFFFLLAGVLWLMGEGWVRVYFFHLYLLNYLMFIVSCTLSRGLTTSCAEKSKIKKEEKNAKNVGGGIFSIFFHIEVILISSCVSCYNSHLRGLRRDSDTWIANNADILVIWSRSGKDVRLFHNTAIILEWRENIYSFKLCHASVFSPWHFFICPWHFSKTYPWLQ